MAEYDKDRQESNPWFQSYPRVIVYCVTWADVFAALGWAKSLSLWVTLRSGGHSTAGFSVNDGMVIDTSAIRYVRVDPVARTAAVGPGTDFDILNQELDRYGLHVPSGACGSVNVAGFMQGGGYGYTSRMYGMNCDNVIGVTLLLAQPINGTALVTATADGPYSDLFWAVRGGTGCNFGIVLEVQYQLYVLPSVWAWAIQWSINPDDPSSIAQAAQALVELQTNYMASGAPPQLGYMGNIGADPSGKPVLLLQGMYAGSRDDGLAALQSLLQMPGAVLNADATGTYGQMDQYLDNNPYPIPNPPDGACEDKQCGYISAMLGVDDWTNVINQFLPINNGWNGVVIEPYGGAINAYPMGANAFIHRTSSMDFFLDVFWMQSQDPDGQKARAGLNGYMEMMQQYLNGEMYQNYPRLDAEYDYRSAYWGSAFNQLLAIKQKYDPNNLFHYAQSISPP